jgi:hypothetical protein
LVREEVAREVLDQENNEEVGKAGANPADDHEAEVVKHLLVDFRAHLAHVFFQGIPFFAPRVSQAIHA